jgi:prevent-host-death family protein
MDEVAESGESVIITKHSVPVSELVPVKKSRNDLFGAMKGQITILGDFIAPIDVEWEANA